MGFFSEAGFFFPKALPSEGCPGCRSEEGGKYTYIQLHAGSTDRRTKISTLSGRVFKVFVHIRSIRIIRVQKNFLLLTSYIIHLRAYGTPLAR